jgi:hypothetical protein
MIDVEKLTRQLQAAGISVSGCNDKGVVWAADGTTEIQKSPEVQAVIAAHKPGDPEKLDGRDYDDLAQSQKDALFKKALVTAGVLDESGRVKAEK